MTPIDWYIATNVISLLTCILGVATTGMIAKTAIVLGIRWQWRLARCLMGAFFVVGLGAGGLATILVTLR